MTRQTRLIAIVVAIGLVGAGALALLAQRLQSRATLKSVRDLPAVTDAPATPGADADAGAGGEGSRAARLVDGFIAVRKAEAEVLAKRPVKAKQIEAALTGNYDLVKGQRMSQDMDLTMDFKFARDLTLQREKMTPQDYVEVRGAYRAWAKGEAVPPAFAPALEARRADLERSGLGGLEILDDKIK